MLSGVTPYACGRPRGGRATDRLPAVCATADRAAPAS